MKIVLIGQGGHSKVIRDMVLENKEYQLVGYLDDKFEELTISDQMCLGPISAAHEIIKYIKEIKFMIAIGNNIIRKLIFERLGLDHKHYATIIQKNAVVSRSAKIGYGTVVMANAVINADAQIGYHAIINTGSVVEHDNRLGDFVHISPRATLTGSVSIGDGAHIGAGATVIPNVQVGKWTVIGAGATVIHDIPSSCTAVGTPAKVKVKTIH
jgi:acetyltransferase EpsM